MLSDGYIIYGPRTLKQNNARLHLERFNQVHNYPIYVRSYNE